MTDRHSIASSPLSPSRASRLQLAQRRRPQRNPWMCSSTLTMPPPSSSIARSSIGVRRGPQYVEHRVRARLIPTPPIALAAWASHLPTHFDCLRHRDLCTFTRRPDPVPRESEDWFSLHWAALSLSFRSLSCFSR